MTKTQMIYATIFSRLSQLENEYYQLRDNVWYRKPDSLDLFEQIIAYERLQELQEFSKYIVYILSSGYKDDLQQKKP